MSGHSHWSSIKHQKGREDAKRSKVFSKVSRLISVAAREGGGDPEKNSKLRQALDKAREVDMPKDNIERAIKRGTGELEGEKLESFTFEAYGPGGIAIIMDGITDNKNRSLEEIKKILSQNNGKLADEGSVKWLFDQKGVIYVEAKGNKEKLELEAIDSGAEDILFSKDALEVYTAAEKLDEVKSNLEEKGAKILSFSLGWVPKETIEAENKEACQKIFEQLDSNDSVQNIYSNVKL